MTTVLQDLNTQHITLINEVSQLEEHIINIVKERERPGFRDLVIDLRDDITRRAILLIEISELEGKILNNTKQKEQFDLDVYCDSYKVMIVTKRY